ncbi:hypothetical protein P691DRAFT_325692 [Macrolepiota fuliginosa MF-IS2]|uniref:Uncharacterized protein n=1 Tax=Macrolepiota fuliginosa MF-IS2 TaxID=1400762 RepID=A0A9P5X786_9AGAR|nr:hypothetical protein P691DRAFT_325692 [Macrolepiota fuliginosa MF-IS2]
MERRQCDLGERGGERGVGCESPRPLAMRSKRSASGHPTVSSFEHLCRRSKGSGWVG